MNNRSTSPAERRSSALIAGLALFVALSAAFSLAQSRALAQEQVAPDDPNELLSTQAEATAAAEPEAPPVDQTEGTVLEDYEASEQISEDLSVSFPVDI